MPDSHPVAIRKEQFRYEFAIERSGPIPVAGAKAIIRCKFRHSNADAIELRPGNPGGLAIGYRVYDPDFKTFLLEHRASAEVNLIAPLQWIECAIAVPRTIIRFDQTLGLMVDVLREGECWFAPSPDEASRFSVDFVVLEQHFEKAAPELHPAIASAIRAVAARFGLRIAIEFAYLYLLGRGADPPGLARKISDLEDRGGTIEQMCSDLLASDEYSQRDVRYLRDPELTVAAWARIDAQ